MTRDVLLLQQVLVCRRNVKEYESWQFPQVVVVVGLVVLVLVLVVTTALISDAVPHPLALAGWTRAPRDYASGVSQGDSGMFSRLFSTLASLDTSSGRAWN